MTTLRIASLLLACASALSAQTRVDHAVWQTPLQNQGTRTTCIAFSATAALEARYKRAGRGKIFDSMNDVLARLRALVEGGTR